MDALETSDLEFARRATPEEKLAQALEMMDTGLRLERERLRREHADASESELEALDLAWLFSYEMSETTIEAALAIAVTSLRKRKRRFALVGEFAVSVRAQVRFTRDVDLAVSVADNADAESLVRDLRSDGFTVAATVEHDVQKRLSTVRLVIRGGYARLSQRRIRSCSQCYWLDTAAMRPQDTISSGNKATGFASCTNPHGFPCRRRMNWRGEPRPPQHWIAICHGCALTGQSEYILC